uniref:Uncharacterized protein n=1 Tax=Ornithodoros erraticus TaxID=265619 RepID=A0A293MRS3_ORNER
MIMISRSSCSFFKFASSVSTFSLSSLMPFRSCNSFCSDATCYSSVSTFSLSSLMPFRSCNSGQIQLCELLQNLLMLLFQVSLCLEEQIQLWAWTLAVSLSSNSSSLCLEERVLVPELLHGPLQLLQLGLDSCCLLVLQQ